jgi:O-antigen ligase
VLGLLTPGLLAAIWFGLKDVSPLSRKLLPGLLGFGAVLCLIWSGSKAGWLVAMVVVGLVLLRSSIPPKWRKHVIVGFAVLGLVALVGRNLDYFQKGAKSVGARTGYWIAAGQTFADNPITGAGPGTFGKYYGERKAEDAEMARLAHNDYVQQASDSGAVGFLAYLTFIVGSLWLLFRSSRIQAEPVAFFIWVGLLGWGLQGLTEFGLYIPAIAWPAFFLLGLLWRESAIEIDSPSSSR